MMLLLHGVTASNKVQTKSSFSPFQIGDRSAATKMRIKKNYKKNENIINFARAKGRIILLCGSIPEQMRAVHSLCVCVCC